MAIEKKYITLNDSDDNQIVSTKLYVDQYNQAELEKAVDITVTELIKALPEANLQLVPKPIYDAEVSHSIDLQRIVDALTQDVSDLNSRVRSLLADSSSLYITNDNLNVQVASLENALAQSATTTYELRLNLTTSLTKALNEATERTALEAENNGLNAQKNALIKQIDTLNNLLAQANASLQVAAQQLSAKQQAVAGGGLSTGELATIVFDGGDPTKKKVDGKDFAMDYNGGPNGVKDKFTSAGDPFRNIWSSYFDIVVGPKDVTVVVEPLSGYKQIPWDFGFALPITLKANETKRFNTVNPNSAWVSGNNGNDGGSFWRSSRPSMTDWRFSIKVTDVDPAGKSESKDFSIRTYKY